MRVLCTIFASYMSIHPQMAMPPNTLGVSLERLHQILLPHDPLLPPSLFPGIKQTYPLPEQFQQTGGVLSDVRGICSRTTISQNS